MAISGNAWEKRSPRAMLTRPDYGGSGRANVDLPLRNLLAATEKSTLE
jgi:hypothetical protein